MPAPRGKVPAYCLHKASGRAIVRLNGRDHYIGVYGSPESHERYAQLIAGWRESVAPATVHSRGPGRSVVSINEMLLAYVEFASGYYTKDGKPNKEFDLLCYAMRPLKAMYGHSPADEFGPRDLKAIQRYLVDQELSRSYINGQINRIKRIFKWAVGEELVAPHVYHGLQAVVGLKRGRTTARESDRVRPVADVDVDAVLPYVAPQVAAMIQVQRLTGMRSGEVVRMRAADIDRTGEVWIYTPSDHKNAWREHAKAIPLGPMAQAILGPFLQKAPSEYLFSPDEAASWHRGQRAVEAGKNRRTKIYPSKLRRLMKAKVDRKCRPRKKAVGDHYHTGSYRQAIKYGIQRARAAGIAVEDWHPHQLRHAKATQVRREFGLEAAQIVLGHTRADVTQVYAERDSRRAIELAKAVG